MLTQNRVSLVLTLLIVGCGDGGGSNDGGVDQGVFIGQLCATASCAAQPCTVGCVFTTVAGDCPSASPVVVTPKTVEACRGFCQGFHYDASQPSAAGYCWDYDAARPGACQEPHCGWNTACEVHSNEFLENQAVICPPSQQCYDGRGAEDAAQFCYDMTTAIDGGAHD